MRRAGFLPGAGPAFKAALHREYLALTGLMSEMVGKLRFFDYRGLGFGEAHPENRLLGDRLPEVLVIGEKENLFDKLRALHAEFGATVLMAGGNSRLRAVEFLVEALLPRLSGRSVKVLSLVDHDPGGHVAPKAFCRHLERYGLEPEWVGHLVTPERFTPEERALYSYPLPMDNPKSRTKSLRWFARTGGVDGQPRGLRADLLDIGRILQAFRELMGLP